MSDKYYKKAKDKKIYATDKKETPNNPYYCILCNKEYTEGNNDINANYMEDYCRYLGYCNIECWDQLSQYEKHETAELALLYGSTHKCDHKFYLKHIKRSKKPVPERK
jgi:hypothetical protein